MSRRTESYASHVLQDLNPCDTVFDSQLHRKELYSFLPRYLKLAAPTGTSQRLQGCCLVADISGFTRLSSDLCALGLSGIDKLRRITNQSFNRFVEIVYGNNGDGKSSFFCFSEY